MHVDDAIAPAGDERRRRMRRNPRGKPTRSPAFQLRGQGGLESFGSGVRFLADVDVLDAR